MSTQFSNYLPTTSVVMSRLYSKRGTLGYKEEKPAVLRDARGTCTSKGPFRTSHVTSRHPSLTVLLGFCASNQKIVNGLFRPNEVDSIKYHIIKNFEVAMYTI